MSKVYLERDDRFYEIDHDGDAVTVRYGKLHNQGRSQTYELGDEATASAFVSKKQREVERKGYAVKAEPSPIAPRGRQATVSRARRPRGGQQQQRARGPKTWHTRLWRVALRGRALALCLEGDRCFVSDDTGQVLEVDLDGNPLRRYQLPKAARALIGDRGWIYAGCDDGCVYELGDEGARVAYSLPAELFKRKKTWGKTVTVDDGLAGRGILSLDVHDASLYVATSGGDVFAFDHEGELKWERLSKGRYRDGHFLACDDHGVYHGYNVGVACYHPETGKRDWERALMKPTYAGALGPRSVFIGCKHGVIYQISREGKSEHRYDEDPNWMGEGGLLACVISPDGERIYEGNSSGGVHCFKRGAQGPRWRMKTGLGAINTLALRGDRLYATVYNNALVCFDVTETAVRAASANPTVAVAEPAPAPAPKRPKPRRQAPAPALVDLKVASTQVAQAQAGEAGIEVVCVKEGGKLRVRPRSEGYNPSFNVQFPRDLRQEGAHFLVESLVLSASGGFYRAKGSIKRLG